MGNERVSTFQSSLVRRRINSVKERGRVKQIYAALRSQLSSRLGTWRSFTSFLPTFPATPFVTFSLFVKEMR